MLPKTLEASTKIVFSLDMLCMQAAAVLPLCTAIDTNMAT
jgi:hypothetical protein